MPGYLHASWCEVGRKGGAARSGDITKTRRQLDQLCGLASTLRELQSGRVDEHLKKPWRSMTILRNHDATPRLVRFGILQDLIQPTARYLYKEEGRWRSLSYEDYLQTPGAHTSPKVGVVEVFAQRAEITTTTAPNVETEGCFMETKRIYAPPNILKTSNASATHTATERLHARISEAGIRELASQIKLIVVMEIPDNVAYNMRKVTYALNQMPRNVISPPLRGCAIHRLHRIAVNASRENCDIGDTHAIAFVQQQVNLKLKLHAAARTLVDTELIIDHLPPPAEERGHLNQVLKHTVGRHCGLLRGRKVQGESLTAAKGDAAYKHRLHLAQTFFNAKLSGPFKHHETGCCNDSQNRLCPERCKNNVYAAIIELGLLGDVLEDLPNHQQVGVLR